jgi:hypothetical protein
MLDTVLPPIIESAAAWRGDELAADTSWRRLLTGAEVSALERTAAGAVRDCAVPEKNAIAA